MIERDVKESLKEYLTKLGAYQYWPVPMGYGATTIDVLFCYRGRFYGVETKRPTVKEPTKRQADVMREIAEAGGGVCLENDPALPAVRKMIERHHVPPIKYTRDSEGRVVIDGLTFGHY